MVLFSVVKLLICPGGGEVILFSSFQASSRLLWFSGVEKFLFFIFWSKMVLKRVDELSPKELKWVFEKAGLEGDYSDAE